jgi:hypothetical protein
VKKKASKIVTIVDSPEVQKMDIDDEAPNTFLSGQRPPSPSPSHIIQPVPADQLPPVTSALPVKAQSSPPHSPKSAHVNMEQEPEVPNQQSHHSPVARTLEEDDSENYTTQTDLDMVEEHLAAFSGDDATGRHASAKELSMIVEDDEPNEQSRVSPVRAVVEPVPETNEDDAVPLRDTPHDPMDQDMTVPLRDEPGPSLKRKPSVSQFSGLPAPSPLRKSMRMSHEPSTQTPGTGLAGGKRTSWLTRAKEAKALDITGPGKRPGPKGDGPSTAASNGGKGPQLSRPKSAEPLGSGSVFPSSETLAAEDATAQQDIAPESEALAFLRNKRKATSLEDTTSVPIQQAKPQPPPASSVAPTAAIPMRLPDPMDDMTVPITDPDSEEYTVHLLQKTLQGARTGKSMGKSLGGNAAAELAEARKAAEARVAQRNREEGEDEPAEETERTAEPPVKAVEESVKSSDPLIAESAKSRPQPEGKSSSPVQEDPSRRMSVSDLMSNLEKSQAASIGGQTRTADLSTSTTPPNSPPTTNKTAAVADPPRVFSKPPTVFVAPPPKPSTAQPAAGSGKELTFVEPAFKLPVVNPFSLPATALGIPAALPGQKQASALSTESSKTSLYSDIAFDKEDAVPAWMSSTQGTALSAQPSQQKVHDDDDDDDMDEDDSWQVDAQYKTNQVWTPFGFGSADKDDTMTWSTLPSRSTSQKGGDTGPMVQAEPQLGEEIHKMANDMLQEEAKRTRAGAVQEEVEGSESAEKAAVPMSDFDEDLDKAQGEIDEGDLQMEDMSIDDDGPAGADTDLEDIVAAGKSTISLVKVSCVLLRYPPMLTQFSATSSRVQPTIHGLDIVFPVSAWILWAGVSTGK